MNTMTKLTLVAATASLFLSGCVTSSNQIVSHYHTSAPAAVVPAVVAHPVTTVYTEPVRYYQRTEVCCTSTRPAGYYYRAY